MSNERKRSDATFDDFFNTETTLTSERKAPDSSVGNSTLIKMQPTLHHRQTPSERDAHLNSRKAPLTTNHQVNVSSSLSRPTKEESPRWKRSNSDVENERLPSVQRPLKKPSSNPMPRKNDRYLPYIRPKQRRKATGRPDLTKRSGNEIEDRIRSAQRNKVNELQSRLNELRRILEKEQEENRSLRIIQKREEAAMKKCQDQEYDIHRVVQGYSREIRDVNSEIEVERKMKGKLEIQVHEQEGEYREQKKKIAHCEKLVNDPELEELEQLEERLKKMTKKLKQVEEKIQSKEKYIRTLEKNHRNEIQDELIKQRDLKRQLEEQSNDYQDLLSEFDEKNRQVGTMHIYIQRGGRRPSKDSVTLSKSRSLQSLHEPSPNFRQKMLEYDRHRREQRKFEPVVKPKPKLKPLPAIPKERVSTPPPPRPEPEVKKKLVPKIEEHPAMIKPRKFEHSPLFLEEKGPLNRRASVRSIEEEKSNLDDDTYQSTMAQSPTPSPTLPGIQHPDHSIGQARIHRRLSSPLLPPLTAPTHLAKRSTPPPSTPPTTTTVKPQAKDDTNTDKWFDLLELDPKPSTTTKSDDDLISKLLSHDPQPKNPSTRRPNMIMFEPSTIASNGQAPARKPWAPVTTNVSPTDPFGPASNTMTKGKTNGGATRTRDDTFTVSDTKIEPLDGLFGPATTAKEPSLQRPKVVNSNPKTMPSRTYVEEIEEFSL